MRTKIVHLPVELTPDELRSKGRQQAAAMLEYGELETERREVSADLGARMKQKRKELDRLAVEVRTGLETRPVECELVPVWNTRTVVTRRRDTRETIESRPMSPNERQLELAPDFDADDDDDQDDDDEAGKSH